LGHSGQQRLVLGLHNRVVQRIVTASCMGCMGYMGARLQRLCLLPQSGAPLLGRSQLLPQPQRLARLNSTQRQRGCVGRRGLPGQLLLQGGGACGLLLRLRQGLLRGHVPHLGQQGRGKGFIRVLILKNSG
jgi:hypothetical protein